MAHQCAGEAGMKRGMDRRRMLAAGAGIGAAAVVGDLAFLSRLAPLSAEETNVRPEHVQLRPEIAPLVRLLEETPRAQLLEAAAGKIREGTTYKELLAALMLAGV